jgi:5-formyltetrahydrofolate cyclo-ligase
MLPDMSHEAPLAVWRRELRKVLLQRRKMLDSQQRERFGRAISRRLLDEFAPPAGAVIGIYWPINGEFDPRFVARHWRAAGAVTALPVVVQRNAPLQFQVWWPGVATRLGVFGLPCPCSTPIVAPDTLLMPPVGWDENGYRLGYGAGYYDRTLAAMHGNVLKIGVGFELSRIDSIRPHVHDVAMDFVVSESATYRVTAGGLR